MKTPLILLFLMVVGPLPLFTQVKEADSMLLDKRMENDSILYRNPWIELGEVQIVSWSGPRKIMEYPSALDVISLSNRWNGTTSIASLINRSPGLFMHEGTSSTHRLTLRGIGSRSPYSTSKIRIYLDEIPLTNGSGESTFEDMDMSFLERIEIYKGPAPGNYGSGLGGSLVMNSRIPALHSQFAGFSSSLGSFGRFQQKLEAGFSAKKMGGFLLYSHTRSDGYRENNEYKRNFLGYSSQYYFKKGGTLRWILCMIDLRAGIPSSIDSIQFFSSPSTAAPSWLKTQGYEQYQKGLSGISWQRVFPHKLTLRLSGSGNIVRGHELRPFSYLYEERRAGTFRASLMKKNASGKMEWSGGGEIFRESFGNKTTENTDGEGKEGSILTRGAENSFLGTGFLQLQWSLPSQWNLTMGSGIQTARFVYNDLFTLDSADFSGTYRKKIFLSPRFSIGKKTGKNSYWFAGISRGIAMPSLSETLTSQGIINSDIQPETCLNWEIGVRRKGTENRLNFSVVSYLMQVKNMLVAERTGDDSWVGKNAGSTLNRGLELQANFILWQKMQEIQQNIPDAVHIESSFALNDFRFLEFTENAVQYNGSFLAGIPKYRWQNQLLFRWRKVECSAEYSFTGKMFLNDANTQTTAAYSVLNFQTSYHATIKRIYLDMNFSLNNILNTLYASMIVVNAPSSTGRHPRYYYPGLPRHFNLGIRLNFPNE